MLGKGTTISMNNCCSFLNHYSDYQLFLFIIYKVLLFPLEDRDSDHFVVWRWEGFLSCLVYTGTRGSSRHRAVQTGIWDVGYKIPKQKHEMSVTDCVETPKMMLRMS